MNRIENEIELLLKMARSGALPGYPDQSTSGSCYAEAGDTDISEYFSGEIDALEHRLSALWANDDRMQACIPVILAAVEKSRGQENRAVVQTELYNYTM